MRELLLLFFVTVISLVNSQAPRFKVIREWYHINYTWPDPASYRVALDNGQYIEQNIVISGVKYHDGFYYITLPRMREGVSATLAKISAGRTSDTAPLLTPFPSWEMNTVGDCNALQNVQNVEIDPKGYIWIIDGGRTETLNSVPVVKCKPKLIIYDIKNEMKTTEYTFPDSVASFNGSFLYDLVVDQSDGGYAYITDNSGRDPGIIVYSMKDNRSWKIRHSPSMRADPLASTFRAGDIMVAAPINIAGIALGPKQQLGHDQITIYDDRRVYYSPLSSLNLYSIPTSVLKNENSANNGNEYQGEVKNHGIKQTPSVGMVMDNQGMLYYGLLGQSAISKWDSNSSFDSENQKVIARDSEHLEWPNSFTFDQGGNITILTNKLNRFIYSKMDFTKKNFRLITANIGAKSYLYDDTDKYNYNTNSMNNGDSMQDPNNMHSMSNMHNMGTHVMEEHGMQQSNTMQYPNIGSRNSDQTMRDSMNSDMHEHNMNDHKMNDSNMHETSTQDPNMHNNMSNNMPEHNMQDHSMHDHSMHDHSKHDHSMPDKSGSSNVRNNIVATVAFSVMLGMFSLFPLNV